MKVKYVPLLPGCQLCHQLLHADVDAKVRGYVIAPRRDGNIFGNGKPEMMDVCLDHWHRFAAIDQPTGETVGRRLKVA